LGVVVVEEAEEVEVEEEEVEEEDDSFVDVSSLPMFSRHVARSI
jgi:hypothetical protein|tara:strand:+ start:484 stop:615 length:132 start_codon:yes stop_codon:yes gene_type:complete